MQGLTAFQYDTLAVLHDCGPCYGLKIKRELEERHDKYGGEVNHSRLYPNLDELVTAHVYVDKSQLDKRTNEYALTAAGKATLRDRVESLGGEL